MARSRVTKVPGKRHAIPSVAIAGYTNAGKSSLLNRLPGLACWSRTRCSQRWTRRSRSQTPRTAGFTRCRTPWASCGTFRTSSSRPSLDPRRGRRCRLCCTWWTASHSDPEGQLQAVRAVFAEIRRARRARGRGRQQGRRRRPAGARVACSAGRSTRRRLGARPAQGCRSCCRCWRTRCPRPDTLVDVVLPYANGALVSRDPQRGRGPRRGAPRGRHPDRGSGGAAAGG